MCQFSLTTPTEKHLILIHNVINGSSEMKKYCLLMLILGWCLHSPVVAAYECYQESPAAESLGDEYRNIDKSLRIDKNEKELLFLKNLKGKWSGSGEEIFCKGSQSDSKKLQKKMQVKAEVEESGKVLFRAQLEKKFPDEGVTRSDRLDLINIKSLYALSVNGRRIEANQREHATNGPDAGVRYLEYMISIDAPTEDELHVEWSLFTNGVYSFTQKLDLTRD
jgi:hypothetical protein